MNVIEAKELQIDGENVSSTKIRRLLKNGEIEKANSLLTYNYTLSGKIVEGYRVGRTIGFPTANIKSWERYKVGDWNTLRIIVKGDNVKTYLNGEEMVDLYDEKIGAAQGRIALQIHDGGGIKVLWRNLILQTL
jgi:hypothetical protein